MSLSTAGWRCSVERNAHFERPKQMQVFRVKKTIFPRFVTRENRPRHRSLGLMADHRFKHDKPGGHCSRSDPTISHHDPTSYRAPPQGASFVLPKPSHLKLIEHNLATAIRVLPQPDNFVRSRKGNTFLEAVSRVSTVPPNIPPRLRDQASCESYASRFHQHRKLAVTSLRRRYIPIPPLFHPMRNV